MLYSMLAVIIQIVKANIIFKNNSQERKQNDVTTLSVYFNLTLISTLTLTGLKLKTLKKITNNECGRVAYVHIWFISQVDITIFSSLAANTKPETSIRCDIYDWRKVRLLVEFYLSGKRTTSGGTVKIQDKLHPWLTKTEINISHRDVSDVTVFYVYKSSFRKTRKTQNF